MGRLREFSRLSWSDRVLLLTAGILVLVAKVGLPAAGLDRTQSNVIRFSQWLSRFVPLDAERIPWGVAVASNVAPVEVTCLPRAVVCHALLEAVDAPSQFRFGIKWEGNRLDAHAWVERDGQVLIGETTDFERYRQLDRSD